MKSRVPFDFHDPFLGSARRWVVLLGLASLAVARLAGQSVGIVNPSFEDITGETPYNEFTFGALNGWDLYDPGNITNGGAGNTYFIGTLTPVETSPGVHTFFPGGAADGIRVGIAFNSDGSGGGGVYGLQQTLSATLQANTAYSLQVDIGNIGSGTAVDDHLYDLSGFPGYRVELLAGGVVIASDDNSLFGTIDDGTFGTSTVSFVTGASHGQLGQVLGIRLVNLNALAGVGTGADLEVDFDNVRLSGTSVPEPATTAIGIGLMAGGAALLWRRRHAKVACAA